MRRILFVTPSLGFGGAAKMLAFVSNQLSLRGHRVSIVNLNINTTDVSQDIDENIKIHNAYTGNQGLSVKIKAIKEIMKISKIENIDVIVGFTMFPNVLDAVAGKILRIPVIMCERGDPYKTFGNSFIEKIIVNVINKSDGAVFQTDGAGKFYSSKLQKKGIVIPNPIFLQETVPNYNYHNNKTIISVGRLDNFQKRYDVMFKAFSIFLHKHRDYMLKIYGDGPDAEQLKQLCVRLGIQNNVLFMGVTKQTMQEMAKGGIFVITSDFEGISNSLLEAMAVGLPCVSTDHTPGGARLLITDHYNGLLVPMGDYNAVAIALEEYVKNHSLASKCGENAKEVIIKYSAKNIIDMWENYLLEVIEKYNSCKD